uniref:C2H2-type domain-containing protein n=1 Tax=Timema poppense TaxID=170557 RepID=A0A7R9CGV9_TIMPO|nr:unnamed protein product [Timema poppensis]
MECENIFLVALAIDLSLSQSWAPWNLPRLSLISPRACTKFKPIKLYSCSDCGKRYRWKSTLNRHQNVECGGKEPAEQCPYCSYKAKQKGNLSLIASGGSLEKSFISPGYAEILHSYTMCWMICVPPYNYKMDPTTLVVWCPLESSALGICNNEELDIMPWPFRVNKLLSLGSPKSRGPPTHKKEIDAGVNYGLTEWADRSLSMKSDTDWSDKQSTRHGESIYSETIDPLTIAPHNGEHRCGKCEIDIGVNRGLNNWIDRNLLKHRKPGWILEEPNWPDESSCSENVDPFSIAPSTEVIMPENWSSNGEQWKMDKSQKISFVSFNDESSLFLTNQPLGEMGGFPCDKCGKVYKWGNSLYYLVERFPICCNCCCDRLNPALKQGGRRVAGMAIPGAVLNGGAKLKGVVYPGVTWWGWVKLQSKPGQVQTRDRRLIRAKTNKLGTGSGQLAGSERVGDDELLSAEPVGSGKESIQRSSTHFVGPVDDGQSGAGLNSRPAHADVRGNTVTDLPSIVNTAGSQFNHADYTPEDLNSIPWPYRGNKHVSLRSLKTKGPPTHVCQACGRTYYHLESLTRHQRVECGKVAQFCCLTCLYETKHKHDYLRHLQSNIGLIRETLKNKTIEETYRIHLSTGPAWNNGSSPPDEPSLSRANKTLKARGVWQSKRRLGLAGHAQ